MWNGKALKGFKQEFKFLHLKTITLAGWERSTSTFLVTNCFLILCDPGVRRERKKEFATSSLPPTLSLKFQDFPEASLFAHFSNLTWPILEYQSNYLHYASSGPFGHYQKDHCKEKLYMCFKSLRSCLTLCDPMSCSPPGSSILGILQGRILEWVAISSSRGSFWPRDWTPISCIGTRILYL